MSKETPEIRHAIWRHLEDDKEAKARLIAEIQRILNPYAQQVQEGLKRVEALVALARLMPPDRIEARQDILRSAIVLTHAHLEDLIRTIASVLLPLGDENSLNAISLVGLAGRPEKFPLGKLSHHRGKLVDEVLRESVAEHLDRQTFNSTDEIARFLRAIGIQSEKLSEFYPKIQAMIVRRHQIVHRADRCKDTPQSKGPLQQISPDEVSEWIAATASFMRRLVPFFMGQSVSLQALAESLNIQIPPET